MAKLTEGKNFISGETVTPTKLHELVNNATIADIVNADISNTAAISPSKLAAGVLPAGITIASANIIDGTIATADLADNAIINAKLRDSAPLSVIGNSTNATADPADIAAANDGEVLRRSGTTLGFGKLSALALAFPSNFPIQIVQSVKTNVQTIDTSTTDWVDVTNLSITLTRAIPSASGKVRVQANISSSSNNSNHGCAFRIMRGTTPIGIGITDGLRTPTTIMGSFDGQNLIASTSLDFIDSSPGATTTVQYKIQARIYSTVLGYINRSSADANVADYSYRTISTMTLTELAP
jgi:hypothetical protein